MILTRETAYTSSCLDPAIATSYAKSIHFETLSVVIVLISGGFFLNKQNRKKFYTQLYKNSIRNETFCWFKVFSSLRKFFFFATIDDWDLIS